VKSLSKHSHFSVSLPHLSLLPRIQLCSSYSNTTQKERLASSVNNFGHAA
jgi:hypothetical protein